MGMVVRLPGAVITRDLIVTFVSVKVDLERLDTPPAFNHPGEAEKCFESGVFVDDNDTFPYGAASLPDTHLAVLVGIFDVLLLHGASGLLFDHDPDGFKVLLKGDALHFRRDIGSVVLAQIETDVEFLGVERLDVLCVPPVVAFALGDIAWLHVDGSLGFRTHCVLDLVVDDDVEPCPGH